MQQLQPSGAIQMRREHSRLAGLVVVDGAAVSAGPRDVASRPFAAALLCQGISQERPHCFVGFRHDLMSGPEYAQGDWPGSVRARSLSLAGTEYPTNRKILITR